MDKINTLKVKGLEGDLGYFHIDYWSSEDFSNPSQKKWEYFAKIKPTSPIIINFIITENKEYKSEDFWKSYISENLELLELNINEILNIHKEFYKNFKSEFRLEISGSKFNNKSINIHFFFVN